MAIVFTDWNTWTCETYGNHTQNGSLSGIALGANPQPCGYAIVNRFGTWVIYSGDITSPIATFTGLPYTYTDDNVTFTVDDADYPSDTYQFLEYFDVVVSQNLDGTYVVGEPSHLTPYQLDWSSPAAIANKPPRIYGEAIRQAYNERFRATMRVDPVWWPPIYENRPLSQAWLNRLDSFLTWLDIYGLYANQNDNGGDWHNQSSVPTWTVADLLAEIGQSKESASTTAAWLYQQYAIINQLVLAKMYNYKSVFYIGSSTKISFGDTFSIAKANFLAAPFATNTPSFYFGHVAEQLSDSSWRIYRTAPKFRNPTLPDKSAEVDHYAHLRYPPGGGGTYENNDYYPGNFSAESNLALVSGAINIGNGDTYAIGEIQECTISEPSGIRLKGYILSTDSQFAIVKYNTPGGFTFQGTTFPTAPTLSSGSSWAGSILGP